MDTTSMKSFLPVKLSDILLIKNIEPKYNFEANGKYWVHFQNTIFEIWICNSNISHWCIYRRNHENPIGYPYEQSEKDSIGIALAQIIGNELRNQILK